MIFGARETISAARETIFGALEMTFDASKTIFDASKTTDGAATTEVPWGGHCPQLDYARRSPPHEAPDNLRPFDGDKSGAGPGPLFSGQERVQVPSSSCPHRAAAQVFMPPIWPARDIVRANDQASGLQAMLTPPLARGKLLLPAE